MADWIIGTEEFRDKLDSWLFKADQPSADFLHRNKAKIPPMFRSYSRILYRGMKVDAKFIEKVNTTGITFDSHTSWSKDLSVAKKFVDDSKYTMSGSKGEIKILVSKTIPAALQILDIDGFVQFMGTSQLELLGYDEMNIDSAIKEKEVLISKSIKILKKDVKIL